MTRTIDTSTRLCAVIGNPVEHSLSPLIHNAAFEAAGLNYVYLAFRVDDVRGCLTGMRALPSFRGLSVTIPHKLAVLGCLDEVDPMARHVGAVNTVCNEGGRLVGSTTDGPGALRAFEDAGIGLEGRRVLFVGAGGAVRSVAFAMAIQARCSCITILGRTRSRVEAITGDLSLNTEARVRGGSLAGDPAAAMAAHEIIVNGTPVGMYPHGGEDTPIPREFLSKDHVVFDMVYRPMKTRLIRDAEAAGCKTVLGIEMLIHQAALQFETWTGIRAPVDVMRKAVFAQWAAAQ
jgi:shikimate dehydrogenase